MPTPHAARMRANSGSVLVLVSLLLLLLSVFVARLVSCGGEEGSRDNSGRVVFGWEMSLERRGFRDNWGIFRNERVLGDGVYAAVGRVAVHNEKHLCLC
jgi:hypothetical protein